MNATRFFHHGVLCICLAALATPALARTSRDPLSRPQGRLSQELFQAIAQRDLAGVQSLLARGADPNALDSLEFTALSNAAATGQVPIVEALLRAGAKLDASTPYGTGTALARAAATGSVPVVKLLLSRGADAQAARPDGMTALMYAALNGSVEIVQELLRRKVDVNAKDIDGATALIEAARADHPEVARLLLSSGAAIDAADSHGWTALMNATAYGHADVVKLLLEKGANPNAREEKGRTPLLLAAMYGDNPAVIQALMQGGADAQAGDTRHRTALTLATERGHGATAALLRERGGEERGNEGRSGGGKQRPAHAGSSRPGEPGGAGAVDGGVPQGDRLCLLPPAWAGANGHGGRRTARVGDQSARRAGTGGADQRLLRRAAPRASEGAAGPRRHERPAGGRHSESCAELRIHARGHGCAPPAGE
jgi:ankyrin repeat protein